MTSHPGASAGPARQLTGAHRLDLADPGTLQQLRDLQRAAYAVEAGLIGFDGIPPLHETLAELRGCGEAFLGVCDEAGLARAGSWTPRHDGHPDTCRLASGRHAGPGRWAGVADGALDRPAVVQGGACGPDSCSRHVATVRSFLSWCRRHG